MLLDSRLRRLLVRFRGKVQVDYTGPKDVWSVSARCDNSDLDDWIYVAFSDEGDNAATAIDHLETLLHMSPSEFKRKCPKK